MSLYTVRSAPDATRAALTVFSTLEQAIAFADANVLYGAAVYDNKGMLCYAAGGEVSSVEILERIFSGSSWAGFKSEYKGASTGI